MILTVTDLEKQIGERIASARRFRNLTQGELAARLLVTRAQVFNVESGLTVLRADLGWKACKTLEIAPRWLHRGIGAMEGFPGLAGHLAAWSDEYFVKQKRIPFSEAWASVDWFFYDQTDEGLAFRDRFLRAWSAQLLAPKSEISGLTQESEFRKVETVKSELQDLLDRVQKLTEPKGMKAQLAKYLGVPQSRVSEWLSGKYAPAGEIALKLLKWANQNEKV